MGVPTCWCCPRLLLQSSQCYFEPSSGHDILRGLPVERKIEHHLQRVQCTLNMLNLGMNKIIRRRVYIYMLKLGDKSTR